MAAPAAAKTSENGVGSRRWTRTRTALSLFQQPARGSVASLLDHSSRLETEPISEQDRAVLELKREMDLLCSEVSNIRRSQRTIEPDEAVERITTYPDRGVSPGFVVRRLRDQGVPMPWAIQRVEELSGQASLLLESPPKSGD